MKIIIKLFIIAIFIIAELLVPKSIFAKSVSSSAKIKNDSFENIADNRYLALKTYLENNNSPMADNAYDLVYYADEYDIDWRLVAAISGIESGFGKHIPANSYNAYGWANGKYYFQSWEDSIETVSKALREKYYDNGAENLRQISTRYCPPNPAWYHKVKHVMEDIDPFPIDLEPVN